MSNTSDSDTGDQGGGTGSPMLTVELDNTFGDVGETISMNDAVRILSRRLKGSMTTQRMRADMAGKSTGTQMLAEGSSAHSGLPAENARRLLEMLPEEMRTRAVLENGDIRTLLAQVTSMNNEEGEAAGFDTNARRDLMSIVIDETDRIRQEAETSILALIPQGDTQAAADATQLIDKITMGYRSGYMMRIDTRLAEAGTGTLATNPQTGETVASGGIGSVASSTGLDLSGIDNFSDEDAQGFLSRDEVEFLARETFDPEQTVGTLLGEDFARRQGEISGGGQYEVMYDDVGKDRIYGLAPDKRGPGGFGAPTTVNMPNSMTAREVVDLPSTMSRSEINKLGKKLFDGGFMSGEMTDPTDFSDPEFKRAWQNLLYKSIERGESMLSLLDSQVASRREALEDAFSTSLTDPARIRLNGDTLGGNLLGRNLRDDEHNQLIEFMHNLERRNAKINAGFDPDADGTLEDLEGEAITADLEARMQEWIRTENPVEAGGKDVADTYDTMTQLLAGPGQSTGLVR